MEQKAVREITCEVGSDPTFKQSQNEQQTVQIACQELHLWKLQAEAIGRSPSHIQLIEQLLQRVQVNQNQSLEVSKRTYKARLVDLEEFTQEALRLFQHHRSYPSKTRHQPIPYLTSKIKHYWALLRHWLTQTQKQTLKATNQVAGRIYRLLK